MLSKTDRKLTTWTKLIIVFLSLVCLILFWFYYSVNTSSDHVILPFEVDGKFIISKDGAVVYSSNISGANKIYAYSPASQTTQVIAPPTGSVFNPFIYKGKVVGLADKNGDENFFTTDPELNFQLKSQKLNSVYADNTGSLIAFQVKDDSNLYLLDSKSSKVQTILTDVNLIHQVLFSEENNYVVVNCDNRMVSISLASGKVALLASNSDGGKLNPFIRGTDIYYCNNENTEFYAIYKTALSGNVSPPELILRANHDLRMPKFFRGKLFYLEVINNEYLLRHSGESNGNVKQLTKKGVVYNYEFFGEEKMFMIYSDLITPKRLVELNLTKNSSKLIAGHKLIDLRIDLSYISKTTTQSAAYVMTPKKETIKGVIVFVHPGSDFSPRWDPFLINLTKRGFVIVAPNFPGSSGYGKRYSRLGVPHAEQDLVKWKIALQKKYQKALFYLTFSSGNPLMERALDLDDSGVDGYVSLFGIRGHFYSVKSPAGLYLLGKNDYRVPLETRIAELDIAKDEGGVISTYIYQGEGHFFRRSENCHDAINRVIKFVGERAPVSLF